MHDVLDEERRLEVGERNRAAVGERGVQILAASASRLRLSIAGELHVLPRAHSGRAHLLLVDRDAFGQPARHPLIRHLQRDHVRQLVPERRLPLELARAARCGESIVTTRPKQAPSAPIMPGQADVADREVVVLGKDLDQNRALRRELVPLRQRVERLVRQRQRVVLQDRRLVLVASAG